MQRSGLQKTYFVIDSFAQLIAASSRASPPIYAHLPEAQALPAGKVLATDHVFTRGTDEGWATDADV